MSTNYDEKQYLTVESIVDLLGREINPLLEKEKGNQLNIFRLCWPILGNAGLLGLHIPKTKGGSSFTVLESVKSMEALGQHCIDNGLAFAVNVSLFSHASTLVSFASADQVKVYLEPLCRGQKICAYALSEESAGSDAYAVETQARKVDGGYLIQGDKKYVTLGPIADFAIVFASTLPGGGQWGMTAFIVDLGSEGISTKPLNKAGLRSIPIGNIHFENCFIPEENILGKPGSGAAVFEESQIWERSFILASQVGAMQRQFDEIIAHCGSRQQFGKAIGRFQSVSNRIADMRLRLETARLMLHNVAERKDLGKSIRVESALTKLHLSECFLSNSLDSVRIHGAGGYTGDAHAFTDLADSIAGLLIAGTNDIQKTIVSRLTGV